MYLQKISRTADKILRGMIGVGAVASTMLVLTKGFSVVFALVAVVVLVCAAVEVIYGWEDKDLWPNKSIYDYGDLWRDR